MYVVFFGAEVIQAKDMTQFWQLIDVHIICKWGSIFYALRLNIVWVQQFLRYASLYNQTIWTNQYPCPETSRQYSKKNNKNLNSQVVLIDTETVVGMQASRYRKYAHLPLNRFKAKIPFFKFVQMSWNMMIQISCWLDKMFPFHFSAQTKYWFCPKNWDQTNFVLKNPKNVPKIPKKGTKQLQKWSEKNPKNRPKEPKIVLNITKIVTFTPKIVSKYQNIFFLSWKSRNSYFSAKLVKVHKYARYLLSVVRKNLS